MWKLFFTTLVMYKYVKVINVIGQWTNISVFCLLLAKLSIVRQKDSLYANLNRRLRKFRMFSHFSLKNITNRSAKNFIV